MGAITIKIPQNTNGTFEVKDPKVAERILRELKPAGRQKRSSVKGNDFDKLSAYAEKLRKNPDKEMLEVWAIAEKLRNEWRA